MSEPLKEYQQRQFQLFMARAARWTACVNSGAYKLMRTQRGTDQKTEDGRIVFRDLTDAEKLSEALATVDRHIKIASDFADALDSNEAQP